MLLGNVIDNAVKYTPESGRVNIGIKQEQNDIVLSVMDTGPGINQDLKSRVFDRFYRIPGNNINGCGLGLAIAQQCVRILSARLELEDNHPGGLIVKITLST